jgi:hypothetical protein
MSSVLSRSFSGLLLKTYFLQKAQPVVKSFDEIVNNEELEISSIQSLSAVKSSKTKGYDILSKKCKKYWNKLRQKFNNNISLVYGEIDRKILSGKTVHLTDTFAAKKYKLNYPEFKLINLEEKFAPNYVSFPMYRKHVFSDKITDA